MGLFSIFTRGGKQRPQSHAANGRDALTGGAACTLDSESIVIYPADRRIAALVSADGVAVSKIPYVVGRVPEDDEDVSRQPIGLFLQDQKPYRLSRRHFAIVRRESKLCVLDGASHLGTVVNGERIGRKYGRESAPLRAGTNTVVAGGAGSEYVFRIVVS